MTTRRLGGLDRLRGLALVLMLVHHLTDWFGGDARTVIPGWEGFSLTDVAAPAFTVALGASVPLLISSRRRRSVTGPALAGVVLRRYGLLIPIGLGLRAALGFDLTHFGVLETLGLCAIAIAGLVSTVHPSVLGALAVATLVAAPAVERSAADRSDWFSSHVLTGAFPLAAYLGFALLGAAVVPFLHRGPHRGVAAVAAGALTLWSAGLAFGGQVPDRYPGDITFLVPGLAGTFLLYVLVTSPRLTDRSVPGRLIAGAGAHTFGVFVGHYAVYAGLRAVGALHTLPEAVALAIAVVCTLAIVLVAPRVPTLPWSPRTGWAQRSTPPASEPVAVRSPAG